MRAIDQCFVLSLTARIFGLLLGIQNLSAQYIGQIWSQIDQSSGMSEMQNAFLSSDLLGQTWISSVDGFNCFDGKQIKQLHFALPNGQSDPIVSSKMFEDAQGNLWCTTAGGIHCIPNRASFVESWQIKVGADSVPAAYHYGICLEQDSLFWVIADDQLYQFNILTKKAHFLHTLQAVRCYPILSKTGKVKGLAVSFFGTGIEIIEYFDNAPPHRQYFFHNANSAGQPVAKVYNFLVEQDSLAWIPSSIGLLRFNLTDKSFKIFHPPPDKEKISFCDAAIWKKDWLWLSSVGYGIYLFSIKEGKFVANVQMAWVGNQPHDILQINNLFIDKSGTLWLANWKKEILYASLSSLKFQHYLNRDYTASSPMEINTITSGKKGELWCGVKGEGFCAIPKAGAIADKDSRSFYPTQRPVNYLYLDEEDRLWQLTDKSASYLDLRTGLHRDVDQHKGIYRKIVPFRDNGFLIMTYDGLLTFYQENKGFKVTEVATPALSSSDIINIWAGCDGKIYLALLTNKMIETKINKGGLEVLKTYDQVGLVNDMVEEESGTLLWLASSAGLIKIEKTGRQKIKILDKQNLLSRSFNAILQDHHHNLWLSSNAGLFKYNPSTGEVKHYTESDGLQGLQFMLGSACKLSDGRLAFGGVNGLNIFHPDSVRDNPNPPIIHFTDWIVNDTGSISTSPEYLSKRSFSYNNRTLSFHFVGIDYTAPDEVQYKYRLAGYEKDTVQGGTNGFARYAQLPAGDYTFQVWAANSDGVWSTSPHELHFTIEPPLWATWWARSLEVLFAIGLLYAFYQNRITRIRRKETERRKEAEFRQKEAESKQLAAELQNSVLRLQMNPHFIFNSMNSISSYILQKDIDTANDYLSRFAKLMRLILDLASKPLIPIADEIELLEQYMAAEAMRFEQKFTWEVEVADELDPEEILLPTMILQPFVENAIRHGFSRKTSLGHIRLTFKKQGDSMICSVEDNGVGRQKSSQKITEGHQSKAVQLTEQRLQLIENKGLPKPHLEIIDLYDETGLPAGTRVEILLPLEL